MAERTLQGPQVLAPVALSWRRISPALVPVFAVITALIIGVPFMIVTSGRGDIGRGLYIAGTAYSAMIEGSIGLAINDLLSPDNLGLVQQLSHDVAPGELRRLERTLSDAVSLGVDNIRRYGALLERFPQLADEQLDELGSRIPEINAVGAETLNAMRPFIEALAQLDRGEVRNLAERIAGLSALSTEDRSALESQVPTAESFGDDDLLHYMEIVNTEGIVKLERLAAQLDTLNTLEIPPRSHDAADLAAIAATGAANVREMARAIARMDAVGISDTVALAEQLRLVRRLYESNLLADNDLQAALDSELTLAIANNLIVRRPGDRLLVDRGSRAAIGIIYTDINNTPDNPADDKPEAVYLRLGGNALLFFPTSLEAMTVRSIPFVIVGLAVALAFKGGMFNIGAEGQLYAAGVLAAWVGFTPMFANLPAAFHVLFVLIVGVLGGLLWGAIPGVLKAYTGAHEVITTIMLNFTAIRLVDWLIKSTEPVILLDTAATSPRTPFIVDSARLPTFDSLPPLWYILAGILVLMFGLWRRQAQIREDARAAVRPILNGALVMVGGLFLAWTAVRSNLHIGLLVMVFAVWFTQWFLNRTTLGFELRTVGANVDAARYAGMNVKFNTILAMMLAGALAGLAGGIEVSGVQFNMKPEFFAGLGFDAIAVALLARTDPRRMIPAGFLWGALLTGAGLMQVRAAISIDLVKIIQALIIMFIATDAIIRYLWRVPEPTAEEQEAALFSRGWGG